MKTRILISIIFIIYIITSLILMFEFARNKYIVTLYLISIVLNVIDSVIISIIMIINFIKDKIGGGKHVRQQHLYL